MTCANTSPDDSLVVATSKDHLGLVWKENSIDTILYSLSGHKDIVVR